MQADLSSQIEAYLLARADWVPEAELVERFGLPSDRPLRADRDKPGLCTAFAICAYRKGLKHVSCATPAEWIHFKHAVRRHGIAELVRVRDLDRRRSSVTRSIKRPPVTFERDTNQVLMEGIA